MEDTDTGAGGQLRRTAVNLSVRYYQLWQCFVGRLIWIVVDMWPDRGCSVIAGGDRSRVVFAWCAPERWTYAACVRKTWWSTRQTEALQRCALTLPHSQCEHRHSPSPLVCRAE
jgi:hypothetical protein